MNNLLSLVGDIVQVQAVTSNATRGHPLEETAAMVFTFANGALGARALRYCGLTAVLEQTSQENKSYHSSQDEDCYHIAGTRGSLSVPTMRQRSMRAPRPGGSRSPRRPRASTGATRWPIRSSISPPSSAVSGTRSAAAGTGSKTLLVVDAVIQAARTGQPVNVAA